MSKEKKLGQFVATYKITATVRVRVEASSFKDASKKAESPPCEWANIFNEREQEGGVIEGIVNSHALQSVSKI